MQVHICNPSVREERQEDREFEASLGCIIGLSKKKRWNGNNSSSKTMKLSSKCRRNIDLVIVYAFSRKKGIALIISLT
jgi:hypothetical protein